jgi:hypothetical protein
MWRQVFNFLKGDSPFFGQSPASDFGFEIMNDTLTYLPPLETFYAQNADVYTNTGTFPPPAANKRVSLVSIMITGTFMEGHRQKLASTDSYTHVILCDPTIEIRDPYKGAGNAPGSAADYITIPANSSGGTANWWKVVDTFITNIPGLGQRRVTMLDRWGTPGTWANVP